MYSSVHRFVMFCAGSVTLWSITGTACAQEVVITDLTGSELSGKLIELNSQEIKLESQANVRSISAKELSRLSFAPSGSDTAASDDHLSIQLTDGSQLKVASFASSDNGWNVTMPSAPSLTSIAKDSVASVQFVALKGQAAETWKQLLSSERTSDLLTILRGDDLETLAGAIISLDGETVQFELDGQLIPAPRTKVAGLIWFRRDQANDAQAVELVTKDGSRIQAQNLVFNSNSSPTTMTLSTVSGVKVEVNIEKLQYIEYASANRKWLEEVEVLESVSLMETSSGVLSEARRKLLAPKFVIEDDGIMAKSGHKNLVFAGPGQITFRSPADYSRLAAVVQRNRSANVVAPLTIVIKCDDEIVLSQELTGDQIRVELNASIKPNKRCEIEITSKSQNPYGSNVTFIQPHLLP